MGDTCEKEVSSCPRFTGLGIDIAATCMTHQIANYLDNLYLLLSGTTLSVFALLSGSCPPVVSNFYSVCATSLV